MRHGLRDPRIQELHRALEARPPRRIDPAPDSLARAAVALLVRPAHDLEILLIERSRSPNDPWSGHMALPGGRLQSGEDPLGTAIRETREEVGADLARDGILIGQLDDVEPSGGGPQIAVSPFVFAVPANLRLTPEPAEVAQMVWIPLEHLASPASAAEHLHVIPGGDPRAFPALAYGEHVIWGLTYRMLIQFLGIVRTIRHVEGS